MNKKNALIIFIKNAEAGKVKTRLARSIGNDKALQVYQEMLEHTFQITQSLPCGKYVYYSERIETADRWLNNGYYQRLQLGADLGERMLNAFTELSESRYEKVVIIGSDCFELTAELIKTAFDQLEQYDAVIGPALDGGYYLLGLKKFYPDVFFNKLWSTGEVLQQTLSDLKKLTLKYVLLPTLRDVDDVADLVKSTLKRL
jgi:hypothetical protein